MQMHYMLPIFRSFHHTFPEGATAILSLLHFFESNAFTHSLPRRLKGVLQIYTSATPNTKGTQKPKDNHNDYHDIQDRLDR
jgi:hypothetical protein